MEQYPLPRQAWDYSSEDQFVDQGRDGQNKFWSRKRFKPNTSPLIMMIIIKWSERLTRHAACRRGEM
jgi:hypothetical protein